ncbi:pectate lyase family protein [Altererythrobacter sp. CAU 1778]
MSGLDMVARGIARRAGAAQPALFTAYRYRSVPDAIDRLDTSGYHVAGRGAGSYVADAFASSLLFEGHPRFIFRTGNGRYFRLCAGPDGLIHADQCGAVGDGATPCDNALFAALQYCEAIGASGVRLGKGTYVIDNAGGLAIAQDGLTLRGEGMERTVLRQVNHATTNGCAVKLGSCERLVVADITLHGTDAYGTLHSSNAVVRHARFERVRFTSDAREAGDGRWFSSTNGIRWVVEGSARAQDVAFVDCEFRGCGRMGVEFQNHTADDVARYSDIAFVRPRFIDIGGANASAGYSAGMGISLSGYGEQIRIDQPYFDNVRQVCIELVGPSRVEVRGVRVRYDTLGAALIQATNGRAMSGHVIDGLRWVGPDGASVLQTPPSVPVSIRLDNWRDGVLRDIHLTTAGDKAVRLGVNYPSPDNLVENCVLQSNANVVIENFKSPRNRYRGNRITATGSGGVSPVGVFGAESANVLVDGNALAAPNAPASWAPVMLTGGASVRYTDTNTGKRIFASGVLTMASGSKYVGVDHGLGVAPASYGIAPLGNVGNTNSPPWCGAAANVINAQTSQNVSANVNFAWWARAEFGNL